jgi:predicted lipoprotein
MLKSFFAILVVTAFLGAGCGSNNPNGPADGFDRGAMLKSMAQTYIQPQYDEAIARAEALLLSVESLAASPSEERVRTARSAWLACAEQWQRISMFDFGPAEGILGDLVQIVGTFPSNAARIEALIAASDTAMTSFERDVRGIYALDYLLFSGSESDVIAGLTSSAASARGAYLRSVARHLLSELRRVRDAWDASYAATFSANIGTDAGSSTSAIVNNLAMSFEVVKNDKVGLPGGFRAGQKRSEPERVEARYSDNSMRLARLHFESIRAFWEGQVPTSSTGASFISIRQYLENVVGGPRLVEETRAQFAAVEAAFDACGSATIASLAAANDPRLAVLHTELQKLTRFLKSELSSLLGVAITYSSGDGD